MASGKGGKINRSRASIGHYLLSAGGSVLGTRPPFRAADAAARGNSYWRAHPIRADRLARALAARSGTPIGWSWKLGDNRNKHGLPATYRTPPAPYRERAYMQGPGFCCVCGQRVYRFGWHVDLWDGSANMNANWHCACVIAWQFWNAPNGYARLLRRLQALIDLR